MRQMEKSTRDFADWRKEREKEVMQLRRQVSETSHRANDCPVLTNSVSTSCILNPLHCITLEHVFVCSAPNCVASSVCSQSLAVECSLSPNK